MHMLKFHKRIIKIMKIMQLHWNVVKKNQKDKILCENQETHYNPKISIENHENH